MGHVKRENHCTLGRRVGGASVSMLVVTEARRCESVYRMVSVGSKMGYA